MFLRSISQVSPTPQTKGFFETLFKRQGLGLLDLSGVYIFCCINICIYNYIYIITMHSIS
jgi:hypothetical protein